MYCHYVIACMRPIFIFGAVHTCTFQSEQQQHTAATEDIDEGIRSQCNVSVPRPYVQTASLLDRLKLKLLDWEDGDKQVITL